VSLTNRALLSSTVLGSGAVVSKILALVRNIILARAITPEDFGIAATFIITMMFLQAITEVAADKLMVQAREGDDAHFQHVLHFFQVARGVFGAAIIFLFASSIADLFGAPEAAWAFRWLAIIPLLRGFNHLDLRRVQRRLRFKPAVAIEVTSQLAAVILAVPLAFWLRDYRAALWILIAQAVIFTVGTHLCAERRFKASWDERYFGRLMRFGWPLMINGVLMFLLMQGDRLVIAAATSPYTLADLGVYSVALTLIMTPRYMFVSVTSSLLLPILSKAQDNIDLFHRRYRLCIQLSTMLAALVGTCLVLTGTVLVIVLYGAKYAGVATFIGWLAAMVTLRTIRAIPSQAGLAYADSTQLMLSNLARVICIGLLIPVALMGLSLAWIAAVGFFGELVALITAVALMASRRQLPAMMTLRPVAIACSSLGLAGGAMSLGLYRHGITIAAIGTVLIMGASFAWMMLTLPAAREFLLDRLNDLRARLRRPDPFAPPASSIGDNATSHAPEA